MAKKILLIVFGVLLLLIGLAVAALGSLALAVGGRSGAIHSGFHPVSTPTHAFVSDAEHIRQDQSFDVRSGHATLEVDARNGNGPLFIGVAPAQQVQSYLAGSAYTTVTDVHFGPFRLDTRLTGGTAQPARPADQSFWVAQSSGPSPHLAWKITGGDYRLVVMNADASGSVRADARLGLRIPDLFGVALGSTIGGCLVALLGLALLVWGIATHRPPAVGGGYGGTAATPPGGSGGGGPPGYGQPTYPPSGYQPNQPAPPGPYPTAMPAGSGPEAGDMPWTGTGDATGNPPAMTPPPDATTEAPPERPRQPGAHRRDR
jgi:hypothetical protein